MSVQGRAIVRHSGAVPLYVTLKPCPMCECRTVPMCERRVVPLYVTLEPCPVCEYRAVPMCRYRVKPWYGPLHGHHTHACKHARADAGAILQSRIVRLVCGAPQPLHEWASARASHACMQTRTRRRWRHPAVPHSAPSVWRPTAPA